MHRVRHLNLRYVLMVLIWVTIAGAAALSDSRTIRAQSIGCLDVTLANGALWHMCPEQRNEEGIVLKTVTFTPPGQPSRLVLFQINLAEIHVPYDDHTDRFFDVTVNGGLGGTNLQNLTAGDCPGGTLIADSNSPPKNVLCQTVSNDGYAYRHYNPQTDVTTLKQATALTLFSVSQVGQYSYIVHWKFSDDGSIEPSVGATGRLQKCTANAIFGWPLRPTTNDPPCTAALPRGTSHTHNYWWRIDFDLNGAPNDVYQGISFRFEPPGTLGTPTRPMEISTVTTETAAPVSPTTFGAVRVGDTATTNIDGHNISYEIVPQASHVFRGPNDPLAIPYEPWTAYDIYLTQFKACEDFVANNLAHNPGCGADRVSDYVNGETVTDVVLWYGTSSHHLPRDEDDFFMSPHFTGFQIVPRDMTHINPR